MLSVRAAGEGHIRMRRGRWSVSHAQMASPLLISIHAAWQSAKVISQQSICLFINLLITLFYCSRRLLINGISKCVSVFVCVHTCMCVHVSSAVPAWQLVIYRVGDV